MVDCILLDDIYEILIYTYVYVYLITHTIKEKGKQKWWQWYTALVMFQAEALYESQGLQLET